MMSSGSDITSVSVYCLCVSDCDISQICVCVYYRPDPVVSAGLKYAELNKEEHGE